MRDVATKLPHLVAGTVLSETLALIAAAEAMHATHLISTATGISTALLANYFSDDLHPLSIMTVHALTSNATCAPYRNVRCVNGDTAVVIPNMMRALPAHARVAVLSHGPKGEALVLSALRHPIVVLAALDAEPSHTRLLAHSETLLHTTDVTFRRTFGSLDEASPVKHAPHTGTATGLWLAGRSKLLLGPSVHIALGSDLRGLQGLLHVLRATLRATAARPRLVLHVLVPAEERGAMERAVRCISDAELGGARLEVVAVRSSSRVSQAHGGCGSTAALNQARFHLAALLPGVPKVLYLDTDTLPLGDPTPLVDASFQGEHERCAIAVVPRRGKLLLPSLELSTARATALGLEGLGKAYMFNAGIMLLNLDAWRARALTRRVLHLQGQMDSAGFKGLPGNSVPGGSDSQSVLCLYFQNASNKKESCIEELPAPWNVDGLGWKIDRLAQSSLCAARALHWSGPFKPWHTPRSAESARASAYRQLWRSLGEGPRCAHGASGRRRSISSLGFRFSGRPLMRPRHLDASCRALGVRSLERVPIYAGMSAPLLSGTHGNEQVKWALGHFPWWRGSLRCPAATSPAPVAATTTTRPLALLMTVDRSYVQLVPAWAAEARSAAVGCILGAIGAGDATQQLCKVARRAGCKCITSSARRPRDSAKVFAVRIRFDFARRALRRGLAGSLLMHDADVFFRPGGLRAMAQTIDALPPAMDFALSDNGPRRNESFDDLNWGFAWISGSNTSLSLLDCVLAEWGHPSFDRPSGAPNPADYYERSQPRINHILEAAIAAGSGHAPRVCTFVRREQDRALRHMTGLYGAHAKLLCARAENASRLPAGTERGPRRKCVLAYSPPLHATASAQQDALNAALRLRIMRNCTLALPAAVYRRKPIPLCRLFEPSSVPLRGVDAPEAARQDGTMWLDFEELRHGDGATPFKWRLTRRAPIVRLRRGV